MVQNLFVTLEWVMLKCAMIGFEMISFQSLNHKERKLVFGNMKQTILCLICIKYNIEPSLEKTV